jgi:hypothetical protein
MNAICTRTNTRSEACCCGACARGARPDAKRSANKRDALALLDLLSGCIENHPTAQDRATWSNVGDAAHLREKLIELAVGFALGPDGSEANARQRIEEALCESDEHVGEALIDSM